MPTKKSSSGDGIIELHRLPIERIDVRIIGLSPLIPHSWSEKSRRMMPGHPESESVRMAKKGVRNPEEEATSCVYWLKDGQPAMPATAYKAAMVNACRLFAKPSMIEAKQLFFVEGTMVGSDQFVPFSYQGEPVLREDTPRNANGGTDLRYRYAFYPWWTTLTIRYIATNISATSIVTLVDAAGSGGIGDWRPSAPKSSTGTFGTWRVMSEEEEADYD
jgi:hypothetical protein